MRTVPCSGSWHGPRPWPVGFLPHARTIDPESGGETVQDISIRVLRDGEATEILSWKEQLAIVRKTVLVQATGMVFGTVAVTWITDRNGFLSLLPLMWFSFGRVGAGSFVQRYGSFRLQAYRRAKGVAHSAAA